MRIVIQQLAIFLLPILLYAAYLLWRRWRARVAGDPEPPWEHGQWFWAIVAGLVLSIAVFLGLAIFSEGSPDALFRPPVWKP
jgi:membrane protein implicated in regulation of membrane protease activity